MMLHVHAVMHRTLSFCAYMQEFEVQIQTGIKHFKSLMTENDYGMQFLRVGASALHFC